MLQRWSYKKEYLLIAATILLLVISYQFSFKNTIAAWQLNSRLKKQVQQTVGLSYQPGYLMRKDTNLNKLIGFYKTDTTTFRSGTISIVAALAEKNDVKLIEVPAESAFFHTDKFIIQQLNFTGNFFNLNNFLNQLQSLKGAGRTRSVMLRLETVRNSGIASQKLILKVYLECLKQPF